MAGEHFAPSELAALRRLDRSMRRWQRRRRWARRLRRASAALLEGLACAAIGWSPFVPTFPQRDRNGLDDADQ